MERPFFSWNYQKKKEKVNFTVYMRHIKNDTYYIIVKPDNINPPAWFIWSTFLRWKKKFVSENFMLKWYTLVQDKKSPYLKDIKKLFTEITL